MAHKKKAGLIATAAKQLSMAQMNPTCIKRGTAFTATTEQVLEFLSLHHIDPNRTKHANWHAVLKHIIATRGVQNLSYPLLIQLIPCKATKATIRNRLAQIGVDLKRDKRAAIKQAIKEILEEEVVLMGKNAGLKITKQDILRALPMHGVQYANPESVGFPEIKLQCLNGYLAEIRRDAQNAPPA